MPRAALFKNVCCGVAGYTYSCPNQRIKATKKQFKPLASAAQSALFDKWSKQEDAKKTKKEPTEPFSWFLF